MTIFAIADMHFDHRNIIKYDNRPFADVGEMNAAMIENWNNTVKSGDTVYHIGDFVMSFKHERIMYFCTKLNGNIVFIRGNHDGLLDKVLPGMLVDVKMVKYNHRKFWLSHYQHAEWPEKHRGAIHLFGHSHGRQTHNFDNAFDMCANSINYTPMNLDEIIWTVDSKLGAKKDD